MKYILTIIIFALFIVACNQKPKAHDEIIVGLSADYPPFEYIQHGKLIGFDIELAQLIAKQLNKKIIFKNMQFSTILPSLSSNYIDAGMSTITITTQRAKSFSFSTPYYFETLATIYKVGLPIVKSEQLKGKKVACQLGTTMEIWLKQKIPSAQIVTFDNNSLAVEALKSGNVDAVLIDGTQAKYFSEKNRGLNYAIVAQSEDGYGIAVQKNSPLVKEINTALETLKANGSLEQLKQKWLGH